MAVMTAQQRAQVWSSIMADLSSLHAACGLTKPELRAAVDATDQWCSDNAASFNTALPQPARNVLTAEQKARLLMLVVAKRHGVGV